MYELYSLFLFIDPQFWWLINIGCSAVPWPGACYSLFSLFTIKQHVAQLAEQPSMSPGFKVRLLVSSGHMSLEKTPKPHSSAVTTAAVQTIVSPMRSIKYVIIIRSKF